MSETILEAFQRLKIHCTFPKMIEKEWTELETALKEQELEYHLGQAVALEQIPNHFLTKAGTAFAAGNDDRAKFLREVAQELKAFGQQARAHYHSLGGTKGK